MWMSIPQTNMLSELSVEYVEWAIGGVGRSVPEQMLAEGATSSEYAPIIIWRI